MGLQFIMGNSGAGKSRYAYQKILAEAMRHPEKTYLIIVPEQFTMQTQKELVSLHPAGGILNVDILSFQRLAYRIFEETGVEVRVTVPGHTQRGGSPCPYDRVLCTRLGSAAAQAVMDEDYGNMIAMINGKTKRVPLGEVAGRLKTVDPDCQMIKEAKRIGISFGD